MALVVALLQEKKEFEINLEDQGINRGDLPMETFLDDFRDSVIDSEAGF
jgi:hypothetical protein